MITLDFETDGITRRPEYPPRPSGVALEYPDRKTAYVSCGHPGSRHTMEQVGAAVKDAMSGRYGPVLMHNSIFDLDVAETWFGARPAQGFEDTLYLAFLNEPHAETLALKPTSERLLGLKPDERDSLTEWLMANNAIVKRNPKRAGEFISTAPATIVGPYAIGDVTRTRKLFNHLMPLVSDHGMREAYEVEKSVTKLTLGMERVGVRVDVRGLRKLQAALNSVLVSAEARIQKRLGMTFNVGSGDQLAEVLLKNGLLREATLTPTGKQSTAMDVLRNTCTDTTVVKWLNIRSVAEKYVGTFVGPWLEAASQTGGYVLPRFNQVRGTDKGGARSGRYASSEPNLMNIPTNSSESRAAAQIILLAAMLEHFGVHGFKGLRHYILPDEGCHWAAVDYAQQELRLLAEFLGGVLLDAYIKNPDMDVHAFFRDAVRAASGNDYPRKYIKTLVFGILYGMGLAKLADETGLTIEEASVLRQGLYKAIPGLREFSWQCASEGNSPAGMRTLGGRIYHTEEPTTDEQGDVVREYGYKMLNYRIQGSAADYTKRGMLAVAELGVGRIAVTVHDELGVMLKNPRDARRVADAMCAWKLKVPMMADIKISDKSWGAVK
jgi:DNA polymerase-1